MTRVIIQVPDPMPQHRAAKVAQVNEAFNRIAATSLHQDQAYAQKRSWAATNDQRLKPEADLRGITVEALASLILSKPDMIAARELRRQRIMMKIDAAKTPAELDLLTVTA